MDDMLFSSLFRELDDCNELRIDMYWFQVTISTKNAERISIFQGERVFC